MTVATPTGRRKSVCNLCVIEVFGGVFVFARCFLEFSVAVGAFDIGLSQISSFCSFSITEKNAQLTKHHLLLIF